MIGELPPDQFPVVLENDMDRARLLWLVNDMGEAKLRKSVAKYLARWPGGKPFVSTLSSRHGHRSPGARKLTTLTMTSCYLPSRRCVSRKAISIAAFSSGLWPGKYDGQGTKGVEDMTPSEIETGQR